MIPRLWLDGSKYQARRINPITGNWDPANWDVSRIDWDAVLTEAEVVIIRLGDGLNLDPWLRAFHGYTVDPNDGWMHQNYNRLMRSPEMASYVVQEQGKPNRILAPKVPDVIAGVNMAQYLITVSDTVTAGDLIQRIGGIDIHDLRVVVPTENQPPPPRWFELWPTGVLNPPRRLANPNKVVTFYRRDGVPMSPQPLLDSAGNPRPIAWDMLASEHVIVGGLDLLRVVDQAGDANDWYVRALDVVPG